MASEKLQLSVDALEALTRIKRVQRCRLHIAGIASSLTADEAIPVSISTGKRLVKPRQGAAVVKLQIVRIALTSFASRIIPD
jgi:hypothetical protein